MKRPKFDAVVEAVHYAPDGKIALARIYERRGATWSDRILLDRWDLVARLKRGKQFVTGQRKVFWGSTFEVGEAVQYLARGERGVITTSDQASEKDLLAGVPVF
jgi:hypothetical protein